MYVHNAITIVVVIVKVCHPYLSTSAFEAEDSHRIRTRPQACCMPVVKYTQFYSLFKSPSRYTFLLHYEWD